MQIHVCAGIGSRKKIYKVLYQYMKKITLQRIIISICLVGASFILAGWYYVQPHAKNIGFSSFFQSKEQQAPVEELAARCSGEKQNDSRCWGDLFNTVIAQYGVNGAFDLLSYAYQKTNMVSDTTCHDLTHAIGREAYRLFAQGKQFSVSEKSTYCNYGFFHGVIEAMVARKKPLSEAKKFCLYMNEKLGKAAPELLLQCYHGIGHGTVNNHDPRTWGSEMAMVEPALAVCDEVGSNREERWRCASGAFHGIGSFYRQHLYNLKVNTDHPFWICPLQSRDEYKEACYRELSAILGMITPNGDFLETAMKINTIPEDGYATETMIAWGVPYKESISYRPIGLAFCRRVPERLRVPCVKSIVRQLIQAGKPGSELDDAILYCSTQHLTADERSGCFDFVFYWNARWNVQEKAKSMCDMVKDIYRGLCYESIQKNASK